MTMRIYVSRDAGAVAVGADEVALALEHAAAKRGKAIEIIRTGSRGLYWLEPMIEVVTPKGRRSPACAAARDRGRNSLAEAADPPHLRALRRDRSALGRGLSRP
jgi:formate dehydrogenase iron-sulfur subunit